MRMAAGISFRVKWPHDCIIVTCPPAAEEANLVVREGIWVENADFGTHLLLRDLVERSILVYGKWGQFGHLGGARRGMSFA